ncbi:MAG: NUDIX hydrolase [Chloroflexota bacterium]
MEANLKSERLNKYFELLDQNPSLVLPKDAPIKIITDEAIIEEWQNKHANGNNDIGVLLQDKYITIIRDLVEFPGGFISGYNRVINTAVLHDGGSGAVILPVMNEKILLIKIFRHPTRQWSVEIPRGFGEAGLSPEEIAQKEVSEEVGGKINQVVSLGIIHNNTGLDANSVHLYLAYLDEVGIPRKAEGITEIIWVAVNEIEKMISEGQITDCFTISAYARAKLMGLLEL